MKAVTLDLAILVADADYEASLDTLLSSRTQALGIRSVSFKLIRALRHDPDVRLHAADYLRAFLHQVTYALVLFDKEGSGRENLSTEELELEVKQSLEENGWENRCEVIVLEPELEVWVWSNSPHVAEALGLEHHRLREVLERFSRNNLGKPNRPKEALQECLRVANKPRSAAIFRQLAQRVSIQTCQDRALKKLCVTLQTWFPQFGSL
ncbi:MAG: methylation-associated defense system protein MAD4 [Anaerolineales bacterium]